MNKLLGAVIHIAAVALFSALMFDLGVMYATTTGVWSVIAGATMVVLLSVIRFNEVRFYAQVVHEDIAIIEATTKLIHDVDVIMREAEGK